MNSRCVQTHGHRSRSSLELSPGLTVAPGAAKLNPPATDHTDASTSSKSALDRRRVSSLQPSSSTGFSYSSDTSESPRRRRFYPPVGPVPLVPARLRALPFTLLSAQAGNAVDIPPTPGLSAAGSGSDPGSSYLSKPDVEDEAGDRVHENGFPNQTLNAKQYRAQALWIQLQDRRSEARELRMSLSEKRKSLRELRKQNNETDNSFMSLLRTRLGRGYPVSLASHAISQRFKEMQSIRGACNSLEHEVETLELELEDVESSREILEARFFGNYAVNGSGHREPSTTGSDTDSDAAPPSRTSLLGIDAERPVDIHPLYKRLLDAIGDRELALEHHMEVVMHRDAILYNLDLDLTLQRRRAAEGNPDPTPAVSYAADFQPWQTTLAQDPQRLDELHERYKLDIEKEDYDFLKEFSDKKADAEDKLSKAKSEVERLRKLCMERGVMRKNAPYHEEYTIFSDSNEIFVADTMSISEEQHPVTEEGLSHERFPILLSNPRHVLESEPLTAKGALRKATRLPREEPSRARLVGEAMKEYGISTLLVETARESKSDFINRWLLHRLRTCPLEAELLYTVFSAKLKVRNMRRWQEDVLYFWPRDAANRSEEVLQGPITTKDSFIFDKPAASDRLNSALEKDPRPKSHLGDSPKHRSHEQFSRPVQSVC